MSEYERRGPNDRATIYHQAQQRAELSGIPHYILSNAVESWIAGQGAKDNFWPDIVPLVAFDERGFGEGIPR